MNDAPQRPWYRLHFATIMIGLFLVVCLAARSGFGDLFNEPRALEGRYGWPMAFGLRDRPLNDSPWDQQPYEIKWPLKWLDGHVIGRWDSFGLIVDAIVNGLLLAASLSFIERLCRRHSFRFRFNLAFLLAATGTIATFIRFGDNWAQYLRAIVLVGTLITIPLTWLACVDWIGTLWDREIARHHRYLERKRSLQGTSHAENSGRISIH